MRRNTLGTPAAISRLRRPQACIAFFHVTQRAPLSSSLHSRGSEEEQRGIFQNMHVKPFPVRAAIDIGTGGVMSLAIARVDAEHGAIQKMMYQTQLPLHLEAGSASSSLDSSLSSTAFTLSEETCSDIKNKMRVLHGAMRRDAFEGLSERAAVLSWPLCDAQNAEELALALTREFKVDVRVLGKSFNADWMLTTAIPSISSEADVGCSHTADAYSEEQPVDSLSALLKQAKKRKLNKKNKTNNDNNSNTDDASEQRMGTKVPPQRQLDQLAFLSHAALSQCVAPQRLLVITEDPHQGMRILGADTSADTDAADLLAAARTADEQKAIMSKLAPTTADSDAQQHTVSSNGSSIVDGKIITKVPLAPSGLAEHRLPVDASSAHRHAIVDIQRRGAASYHIHSSSPNPMLAAEWCQLREDLRQQIGHTLPDWVLRKSALGGVVAATSFNGGVLNIAARVAQRAPIPLDHLEVNSQHHFCGLTDVLLAASFPNPTTVLTHAALAAALMSALETPRIAYLPEVSVAAALLTQPSLWTRHRAGAVRKKLKKEKFFQEYRHRVFARPHLKENPTAAPTATPRLNDTWNDTSYSNSMRGT